VSLLTFFEKPEKAQPFHLDKLTKTLGDFSTNSSGLPDFSQKNLNSMYVRWPDNF
jgi:hypothetical protein